MSADNLNLVMEVIKEVMVEEDIELCTLSSDVNILADTGLDSLGLASVVVKLEEKTGKDPFADGFVNFSTVGELAQLYE